jgi:hypothetical protein
MRLRFVGLTLAGIVAAVPSAQPGLRIVARETLPAGVIETTHYIQPTRTRVDTRIIPARSDTGGESRDRGVSDHLSARIVRCDLQKLFLLDYGDRTFRIAPAQMYPSRAQVLLASIASLKAAKPRPPNLLIETTTVQTGERRSAFGFTARRVVTTRKTIPLDASAAVESETQIDGWYIDLESQPACERSNATEFVAVAVVGNPSSPTRLPVFTFNNIGTPERGYPIDTTTTWRSTTMTSTSGGSRDHANAVRRVVTQLSRETLDPGLFEIPPGFHAAEGRLAALAAHWSQIWQTMTGLVASVFE